MALHKNFPKNPYKILDPSIKMKKQLGYIGLGKMGKNMVLRLLEKGWSVVAYNRTEEKLKEVVEECAIGATSISEMISKLSTPRIVWVMVSHEAVGGVINELVPLLDKGDLIIDGGNSPYQETIKRGKELEKKEIEFLDIGVSGGPGGAKNGACMMVGGKKELYDRLDQAGFFNDTCQSQGFGLMG